MAARGRTFGQRQPPLYIAIQKILEKYPDGQIFKVRPPSHHSVKVSLTIASASYPRCVARS